MLAIVAPGQGAQNAGMLAAWSRLPEADRWLTESSQRLGTDLASIDADADALRRRAQEVLVALGYAAWRQLTVDRPCAPDLLAGHSVGELTVAALGGALDPWHALEVTRRRSTAMLACSAASPGGMVAVTLVGAGATESADVVARAESHGLGLAVNNGPGQLVLAGPDHALERFTEAQRRHERPRTRLVRLEVAGAFHTDAMSAAVPIVADALGSSGLGVDAVAAPARSPVYVRGLDGRAGDALAFTGALPRQVAAPVRWDLVMSRLDSLGATGVLELPPAGTLTGLLRRSQPGLELCALRAPEELPEARAFLDRHLSARPA